MTEPYNKLGSGFEKLDNLRIELLARYPMLATIPRDPPQTYAIMGQFSGPGFHLGSDIQPFAIIPPPDSKPSPSPPPPPLQQHQLEKINVRKLCRSWLQTRHCALGDQCPLAHDPELIPLCREFQKNQCRHGNKCWFQHKKTNHIRHPHEQHLTYPPPNLQQSIILPPVPPVPPKPFVPNLSQINRDKSQNDLVSSTIPKVPVVPKVPDEPKTLSDEPKTVAESHDSSIAPHSRSFIPTEENKDQILSPNSIPNHLISQNQMCVNQNIIFKKDTDGSVRKLLVVKRKKK
jgi:hypothetical protein